jgi:hypothetical protein
MYVVSAKEAIDTGGCLCGFILKFFPLPDMPLQRGFCSWQILASIAMPFSKSSNPAVTRS